MRPALAAWIAAALAAPAAAADWSGEVGLVSDYRFRGVSLSHGRPVMQADLEIEHGSGLYADLWASTLGEGDPGRAEVDVTAGYAADLGEHIGIDVSAMYYAYPSAPHDNYAEATAKLTATGGDFTAELGASYAPAQRGTGHADNLYLFATADYALPRTAVTLKAGVGYERGAFDEVAQGGKWDWTLGGEVAVKPARLGLAYVGSNAGGGGGHALVASAFLEF